MKHKFIWEFHTSSNRYEVEENLVHLGLPEDLASKVAESRALEGVQLTVEADAEGKISVLAVRL